MTSYDLYKVQGQCRIAARHGGGGFATVGSERFVLATSAAYAVGDAFRASADYNDCMRAFGAIDKKDITEPAMASTALIRREPLALPPVTTANAATPTASIVLNPPPPVAVTSTTPPVVATPSTLAAQPISIASNETRPVVVASATLPTPPPTLVIASNPPPQPPSLPYQRPEGYGTPVWDDQLSPEAQRSIAAAAVWLQTTNVLNENSRSSGELYATLCKTGDKTACIMAATLKKK